MNSSNKNTICLQIEIFLRKHFAATVKKVKKFIYTSSQDESDKNPDEDGSAVEIYRDLSNKVLQYHLKVSLIKHLVRRAAHRYLNDT